MAPSENTGRVSTGKLKSVKRPKQYGNATSNLRRLPGAGRGLADPYDAIHSPDKPAITLKRPQEPAPQISPTRNQRKQRQNADTVKQKATATSQLEGRRQTRSQLAVPSENEIEQSSPRTPRRSPRKHEGDGRELPVPSVGDVEQSSAKTPRRSPRDHQDEEGVFVTPPSGKPSSASPGSGRQARNDEMAEDEDEDEPLINGNGEGSVAMDEEVPGQINMKPASTPGKRGRGRPRKSQPSDTVQTPNSSAKKRRGRPPKAKQSDDEATPGDQLIAEEPEAMARGSSPKGREEPEKFQANVKPTQIRISGVHFANERNALEDDTVIDEEKSTDMPRERKRKRKAPAAQGNSKRAGKKAKPTQERSPDAESNDADDDSSEDEQPTANHESEEVEEIDKRRLFGLGWKLDEVYSKLNEVGVSHADGGHTRANIDRDDPDVKAIHRLCKKATTHLTRLRDDDENENAESTPDPPEELEDIKERVRRLSGKNDDFPIDTQDEGKCAQIHVHVIPRLVKLLKHAIEIYEEIDGNASPNAVLTKAHHRTVIDILNVIVEMGNGAKLYNTPKWATIVGTVKNDIVPPLRKVRNGLSRTLVRREQAETTARRQALQAAEDARQLELEAEEQEQREREEQLRTLWIQLHDERRHVEGMVPPAKSFHLRIPDAAVEIDQNGEPFERLAMFARRIGPPPTHVKKARDHVWALKEIDALRVGLRKYAGRGVFRDIFREHCVRGGVLNKYNVTEIVTQAADLKEFLEETQMEEQEHVEDWVNQIPMWTKPHTLLGQENAI